MQIDSYCGQRLRTNLDGYSFHRQTWYKQGINDLILRCLLKGPDPNKGPEERQVSMGYREAMLTDKVDESHKKYWFTEPQGHTPEATQT